MADKIETSTTPLAGYVYFQQDPKYTAGDDKQYNLVANKKLFTDFEKACKYNLETAASALRKLMETYILAVEIEQKEHPEMAKLREMLLLSETKQMKKLMTLTNEEREEFFKLKTVYEANKEKDKKISKTIK